MDRKERKHQQQEEARERRMWVSEDTVKMLAESYAVMFINDPCIATNSIMLSTSSPFVITTVCIFTPLQWELPLLRMFTTADDCVIAVPTSMTSSINSLLEIIKCDTVRAFAMLFTSTLITDPVFTSISTSTSYLRGEELRRRVTGKDEGSQINVLGVMIDKCAWGYTHLIHQVSFNNF
jgi:hypothetical protein